MRLGIHYCSCVLETFKTLGFLEKEMFFSQKHLNLFKNSEHGYFSLECLSKSIIAHENWKRSTAWDFRESRWVISKNCLIFLKRADISNISIECVSNGIFAQNFSILSNFGFSWKKKWGFSDKKAWIFCQIWLICRVWYTIRLKLCFYSRILKTFRLWVLSEKFLEFFRNAKVQGKLSASRNVLMLKGSQTFKFGFFGKKVAFYSGKKAW